MQDTVTRDRNSSFEPAIMPKRARRLGKVEDMILSLYARGMSTRDIGSHLAEIYGTKVSAATISMACCAISNDWPLASRSLFRVSASTTVATVRPLLLAALRVPPQHHVGRRAVLFGAFSNACHTKNGTPLSTLWAVLSTPKGGTGP